MKKFRVLSDLHLDINEQYPISINDKDIFTVICGDTSGYPDKTISWIKDNCPNGVGISGNHLPYNDYDKTIQELREELSKNFPLESSFTYLDCETDVFYKIVDGIIFIGTCMYSDMLIKHNKFNPDGNKDINMQASMRHMNDYRFGILSKKILPDKNVKFTKITANDYSKWFNNAFIKIDNILTKNELQEHPLPVVLITHYNLITDFLNHNHYHEIPITTREYNWPSYASDKKDWLLKHPSIKCYCCGHIHAVEEKYRNFYINRDENSKILIVNNARGYCRDMHDYFFNTNTFVNTETWEIEKLPLTKDEIKEKEQRKKQVLEYLRYFI